jgi:hypothetical protein
MVLAVTAVIAAPREALAPREAAVAVVARDREALAQRQ